MYFIIYPSNACRPTAGWSRCWLPRVQRAVRLLSGHQGPLRRVSPLPTPQARAGSGLVTAAHRAVIARSGGPPASARAAPRGRRPGRRDGRRARLLDEALEGTEARVAQQALQVAVQDHLLGRARGRVVERHILRVDHQPLHARAPARRRAGHAAGFSMGVGRWPGLAREGSRVQDSPQCAGNFKRRHEADGCGIQQSHKVNLCARTPERIPGQGHGRALDAGARLVRIAEGAGERVSCAVISASGGDSARSASALRPPARQASGGRARGRAGAGQAAGSCS